MAGNEPNPARARTAPDSARNWRRVVIARRWRLGGGRGRYCGGEVTAVAVATAVSGRLRVSAHYGGGAISTPVSHGRAPRREPRAQGACSRRPPSPKGCPLLRGGTLARHSGARWGGSHGCRPDGIGLFFPPHSAG